MLSIKNTQYACRSVLKYGECLIYCKSMNLIHWKNYYQTNSNENVKLTTRRQKIYKVFTENCINMLRIVN